MFQLEAMNLEDERYLQKTWPFRRYTITISAEPVTRQQVGSPPDIQYYTIQILNSESARASHSITLIVAPLNVITLDKLDRGKSKLAKK